MQFVNMHHKPWKHVILLVEIKPRGRGATCVSLLAGGGGGEGGHSVTCILISILLNKNREHYKQHDVLTGT